MHLFFYLPPNAHGPAVTALSSPSGSRKKGCWWAGIPGSPHTEPFSEAELSSDEEKSIPFPVAAQKYLEECIKELAKEEKHFVGSYFGSVQDSRDNSNRWQCPLSKIVNFHYQKSEVKKCEENAIGSSGSGGSQSSSGTVSGSTITALLTPQPQRAAFSHPPLNLGTFPT